MERYFFLIAFVFFSLASFGQARNITGLVTDETGAPLIGVTIQINGTLLGTVTDLDGHYTIDIPEEAEIIVFSFVGMLTNEVRIEDRTEINTVLLEDLIGLEEVVVIGYGIQKKSEVIGSVASVDSKDLGRISAPSIMQALQGKAAGVEIIQNSGAPGDDVTFKVRGVGTLNNSDPLYVVDGIPEESINYLSPEDIKSVEILKDAASASIYGARGANGVVLITTKSGKSGKVNINAGYYQSVQNFWKTMDVLDRYEYDIVRSYTTNYANIERIKTIGRETYNTIRDYQWDWLDYISRTGNIHKANLSISGGTDQSTYYLSANHFLDKGILQGSDYKRTNVMLKSTTNITRTLTIGANLNYSNSNQNKLPEGKWSVLRRTLVNKPDVVYDQFGYLEDTPYKLVTQNHHEISRDILNMKFNLDWNPFKDFTYRTNFGFRVTGNEDSSFDERSEKSDIEYDNNRLAVNTSTISDKKLSSRYYVWDHILNYSKLFTDIDHKLDVTAVFSIESFESDFVKGVSRSYLGNDPSVQYLTSGFIKDNAAGYGTEWSSLGIVGRINYNMKEKYLFQVNARADAASRFSPENRWGFFPSAMVGWRLSEEDFMNEVPWITQLKPRISWGMGGNNRIDNYGIYTIVNQNYVYPYGDEGIYTLEDGLSPTSLGNYNILWESTTTMNAGLDFGIFNTLFGNIDVFEKYTSDMLLREPVVVSAGLSNAPWRNAGEIKNQGIELNLRLINRKGEFNYSISGNIAFIRNEVMKLGDKDDPVLGGYINVPAWNSYTTRTVVGREIGEFYGLVADGVFTSEEEVLESAQADDYNVPSLGVGDLRFVDINNDNNIDENDRTFIGSPHADFSGSLNISLTYKFIDFTMFWTYVYGNQIFNRMKYYTHAWTSDDNERQINRELIGDFFNDGVIYSDDDLLPINTSSDALPVLDNDHNYTNTYRISDFFIEDGSYLRLKNLQVSLNAPDTWANRIRVESVNFYFGVENLFTFTKYEGLDPEIGRIFDDTDASQNVNTGLGIDWGNYPQSRKVYFGINIAL